MGMMGGGGGDQGYYNTQGSYQHSQQGQYGGDMQPQYDYGNQNPNQGMRGMGEGGYGNQYQDQ